MHPDRLAKCVFEWDWLKRNNNWSSELLLLFNKLEMSDAFYNQSYCDTKNVECKLYYLCSEEWKESLLSFPKLRTYTKFKSVFSVEPYLLMNLPKSKRCLLAQLRIGVLPLAVETGRYYRKPLDTRTCLVCNSNSIEDELHFICHCPRYEIYRNELYIVANELYKDSTFYNLGDVDKFVFIMSNNDIVLKLAWFTQHAWRERQDALYHQ